MFSFIRFTVAEAAFLVLCGCSTVSVYRALDPSVKPKITATNVVLAIQQHEIYASIRPFDESAGVLGVLIGSTIDEFHTQQVEAGIVPVRNNLLDFNFDQIIKGDLQPQLSSVDWLHMADYSLVKYASTDELDQQISGMPYPYCLIIDTKYYFDQDFDALLVMAQVSLFPRVPKPVVINGHIMKAALSDVRRSIYTEKFIYRVDIPDDILDKLEDKIKKEDNAAKETGFRHHYAASADQRAALLYWLQNSAAPVKEALNSGAKKLSRLIGDNLRDGLDLKVGVKEPVKVDHQKGYIISHESNDRVVVRLEDGSVEVTEQSQTDPLKVANTAEKPVKGKMGNGG